MAKKKRRLGRPVKRRQVIIQLPTNKPVKRRVKRTGRKVKKVSAYIPCNPRRTRRYTRRRRIITRR